MFRHTSLIGESRLLYNSLPERRQPPADDDRPDRRPIGERAQDRLSPYEQTRELFRQHDALTQKAREVFQRLEERKNRPGAEWQAHMDAVDFRTGYNTIITRFNEAGRILRDAQRLMENYERTNRDLVSLLKDYEGKVWETRRQDLGRATEVAQRGGDPLALFAAAEAEYDHYLRGPQTPEYDARLMQLQRVRTDTFAQSLESRTVTPQDARQFVDLVETEQAFLIVKGSAGPGSTERLARLNQLLTRGWWDPIPGNPKIPVPWRQPIKDAYQQLQSKQAQQRAKEEAARAAPPAAPESAERVRPPIVRTYPFGPRGEGIILSFSTGWGHDLTTMPNLPGNQGAMNLGLRQSIMLKNIEGVDPFSQIGTAGGALNAHEREDRLEAAHRSALEEVGIHVAQVSGVGTRIEITYVPENEYVVVEGEKIWGPIGRRPAAREGAQAKPPSVSPERTAARPVRSPGERMRPTGTLARIAEIAGQDPAARQQCESLLAQGLRWGSPELKAADAYIRSLARSQGISDRAMSRVAPRNIPTLRRFMQMVVDTGATPPPSVITQPPPPATSERPGGSAGRPPSVPSSGPAEGRPTPTRPGTPGSASSTPERPAPARPEVQVPQPANPFDIDTVPPPVTPAVPPPAPGSGPAPGPAAPATPSPAPGSGPSSRPTGGGTRPPPLPPRPPVRPQGPAPAPVGPGTTPPSAPSIGTNMWNWAANQVGRVEDWWNRKKRRPTSAPTAPAGPAPAPEMPQRLRGLMAQWEAAAAQTDAFSASLQNREVTQQNVRQFENYVRAELGFMRDVLRHVQADRARQQASGVSGTDTPEMPQRLRGLMAQWEAAAAQTDAFSASLQNREVTQQNVRQFENYVRAELGFMRDVLRHVQADRARQQVSVQPSVPAPTPQSSESAPETRTVREVAYVKDMKVELKRTDETVRITGLPPKVKHSLGVIGSEPSTLLKGSVSVQVKIPRSGQMECRLLKGEGHLEFKSIVKGEVSFVLHESKKNEAPVQPVTPSPQPTQTPQQPTAPTQPTTTPSSHPTPTVPNTLAPTPAPQPPAQPTPPVTPQTAPSQPVPPLRPQPTPSQPAPPESLPPLAPGLSEPALSGAPQEQRDWVRGNLELARRSIAAPGQRDSLRDASTHLDADMIPHLNSYVGRGTRELQFTGLTGSPYKYAFVTPQGKWFLTESPHYADQFPPPRGLPFDRHEFVIRKEGKESQVFRTFRSSAVFLPNTLNLQAVQSMMVEAEGSFQSEQQGEEKLRGVDLPPATTPVGYIGMVPGAEALRADVVTRGLVGDVLSFPTFMNSLQDPSGKRRYRFVTEGNSGGIAMEKGANPQETLRRTIQSMKERGITTFYLHLCGHGIAGSTSIESGIYFGASHEFPHITPEQLFRVMDEFPDCNFWVSTVACMGGGLAERLNQMHVSGRTGRVRIMLQSKVSASSQEGRVEGRQNSQGGLEVRSSYYSVFFLHFLAEGKPLGEAHRLADIEAKKIIPCDAEIFWNDPNGRFDGASGFAGVKGITGGEVPRGPSILEREPEAARPSPAPAPAPAPQPAADTARESAEERMMKPWHALRAALQQELTGDALDVSIRQGDIKPYLCEFSVREGERTQQESGEVIRRREAVLMRISPKLTGSGYRVEWRMVHEKNNPLSGSEEFASPRAIAERLRALLKLYPLQTNAPSRPQPAPEAEKPPVAKPEAAPEPAKPASLAEKPKMLTTEELRALCGQSGFFPSQAFTNAIETPLFGSNSFPHEKLSAFHVPDVLDIFSDNVVSLRVFHKNGKVNDMRLFGERPGLMSDFGITKALLNRAKGKLIDDTFLRQLKENARQAVLITTKQKMQERGPVESRPYWSPDELKAKPANEKPIPPPLPAPNPVEAKPAAPPPKPSSAPTPAPASAPAAPAGPSVAKPEATPAEAKPAETPVEQQGSIEEILIAAGLPGVITSLQRTLSVTTIDAGGIRTLLGRLNEIVRKNVEAAVNRNIEEKKSRETGQIDLTYFRNLFGSPTATDAQVRALMEQHYRDRIGRQIEEMLKQPPLQPLKDRNQVPYQLTVALASGNVSLEPRK